MRASDEAVRSGIHTALGVDKGATLQARLDSANRRLNGFGRHSRGRFSEFSFPEAININELTK